MSSANMHTTLLRDTREHQFCEVRQIVTHSKASKSLVQESLLGFQKAGLLTLSGEEIHIRPEQRLKIAELAIATGGDAERIARELRWQEFETLADVVLSRNGYATKTHLVFRHSGRRYEIDVLGAKEPMVLCVDCKHWHHGCTPSKIAAAAKNQLLRVLSLSKVFALYAKKVPTSNWGFVHLLPIVLTLTDVPPKAIDGVPIVSAFRLRDFLSDISPWVETLRFVYVPTTSMALC